MTAWRAILTLALMIGLLPWGAYSGQRLPGDPVATVSVAATPDDATVRAPARRCHRTALPGGACAMDLLVPPATTGAAPAPFAAPWRRAKVPGLPDWTPPGALDPPRIG